MSKSMLVFDTPQNCSSCFLCRKNKNFISDDDYYVCAYPVKIKSDTRSIPASEVYAGKQYWCPLRPVPEKQEFLEQYNKSVTDFINQIGLAYAQGFNYCYNKVFKEG